MQRVRKITPNPTHYPARSEYRISPIGYQSVV